MLREVISLLALFPKAHIEEKIFVGEGFEEFDDVCFVLRGEDHGFPEFFGEGRALHYGIGVVIEYLQECAEAAIVHVGVRHGHIAQGGYFEFEGVVRVLCDGHAAVVF